MPYLVLTGLAQSWTRKRLPTSFLSYILLSIEPNRITRPPFQFIFLFVTIIGVSEMAPKLEIASTSHSKEELAPIVAEFFPPSASSKNTNLLVNSQHLFGGYSGSNYRVDVNDGSTFCLKITNGYSAEHAELMCRTAHLLAKHGFQECCMPVPKHTPEGNDDDIKYKFVSLKEKQSVPAFLLTFVQGKQADKVMREQPRLAAHVMKEIGGGLARMHAAVTIAGGRARAEQLGIRWYETNGGCCDVQDQVNGSILTKIEQCEAVREHPFVPFYKKQLLHLQNEMKLAPELPTGITHGDPFADNILVNAETGDLSAFIDIEDVCAGPLLFDLACCAIGCCFEDEPPSDELAQINLTLLEALLEGYCHNRKLLPMEKEHFVDFMKLTLLCNCCWRFVKFNVQMADADIPDQAKNSYLELQRRIEYLQDPKVEQEITALLAKQP